MSLDDNIRLFAYTNPNGICRIERIDLPDGRVVIVCQELDENPGQSVTNTAETVATQVCRQFGIDPDKLVWIEHYAQAMKGVPEWDRVTFRRGAGAATFEKAEKWEPMTPEDWRSLGLPPRTGPEDSTPVT